MSIKGFYIDGTVEKYDHNELDNKPSVGNGLTEEIKEALLQIAQKVVYTDAQGPTYYQDLYDALYATPAANLVSITAVYTQSGTVYDSATLDSLKADLVVTANYDDSSSETVTNYTLSGTLTAGTSTITVSYNGKTTTFTVTVTATPTSRTITNNLTDCTNSNAATSIYDGSSYSATLTPSYESYAISAVTITMGGNDVTGTAYNNGTISIANVTGNIVITAVATERQASLSSITAVFVQGSAAIYDTDALSTLTQYLTVTATWSDTTTSTVSSTDYVLSGTLTVGTSTITVSYGGKSDTFDVTVSSLNYDVTFTDGKLVDANGDVTSHSSYSSTVNMFDLDPNFTKVVVKHSPLSSQEFGPYVAFYQSDGTFISPRKSASKSTVGGYVIATTTLVENAAKCRITVDKAAATDAIVYRSN